jgi:transposase InsO family protein
MKAMGLPVSPSNGSSCEVCNCSKMTMNPFPSHFLPALFSLHCLHMDLVAPFNPPSVSGFKYFLTVVDQYSSFKFVRFLKTKSDAFKEFEKLALLVENLQDHSIKEVVSDQGGEFVNKQFDVFALRKGILQFFSLAETPELNGFAECANCTILDKACCLLLTSSLPKTYWAEAVNTATFISNMLATPSRPMSPYEMWTKIPAPCH